MLKLRLSLLALASVFIVASTRLGAETFQENFTTDPAARNWRAFGTASLFHWNSTNQNLEVTWDSAQPNSYFHRPLGTVLTKTVLVFVAIRQVFRIRRDLGSWAATKPHATTFRREVQRIVLHH